LYQWFANTIQRRWEGPSMPLPGFIRHLHRVATTYMKSDEPGFWNAYHLTERFQRIKTHFYNRFLVAHWTPEQTRNVNRLQGAALKVYNKLYPGYLTEEQYNRFILDEGCPIINDSVNLIIQSFSYCANRFAINQNRTISFVDHDIRNMVFGPQIAQYLDHILNITARASERLHEQIQCTKGSFMFNHTHRTIAHQKGRFFTFNPNHFNISDYYPEQYEYEPWKPLQGNENAHYGWLYPRSKQPLIPVADNLNVSIIGTRIFKIARAEIGVDFDLQVWFLNVLDSILGTNFVQWFATFFSVDLNGFFLNLNTRCAAYPNVGAIWYLSFLADCEFPCNVDCRIGMGLEAALGTVFKYWGIALLLALALSPGIFTFLLSSLVLFILLVVTVPALAWGWSIRCAFLTPSVFFAGVSVPYIPVPVTMIFPFCMIDDILALFDKYINTCYDFWWPQYMVKGDVCPTCPNRFDLTSCAREVGMGNGLSNVIYAGYLIAGSTWCNVVVGISNPISVVLPGFNTYVSNQCNIYQNGSDTFKDQVNWCFWSTIPVMFLPAVFLIAGVTFVAFIVPSLFSVIIAAFYVILASPCSICWGGRTYLGPKSNQDDDEEEDNQEKPYGRMKRKRHTSSSAFHTINAHLSTLWTKGLNVMQGNRLKLKKE
jgi:hypothetical protein